MATSKAPTPAIKSQLEALSGKVATAAPQSHLARFIAGELKGGETKHNYAMSVIHSAIEQALKGNQRDIPEATKLCVGKAVKARAYLAGFHVIADSVKPIAYTGKLADAANAPVRTLIADHARAMACEFEVAFLATIENAKVEAAFVRAAKAKAAPAAPAEGEEAAPVAAPVAMVDAVIVDIATSVQAVVDALAAGLLEAGEMTAIANALALYNANALAAAPDLLAA